MQVQTFKFKSEENFERKITVKGEDELELRTNALERAHKADNGEPERFTDNFWYCLN